MALSKASERIQRIVSFPTDSYENIYDLCCDHGKIGSQLHARFPSSNVILIDQVNSIIEDIRTLYSDIPSKRFSIIKEDCTKLKVERKSKNLFILAGIGGQLALDIFKNISSQTSDGHFLFCLNQGVEDFRSALIDNGQELVRDTFLLKINRVITSFSHKMVLRKVFLFLIPMSLTLIQLSIKNI